MKRILLFLLALLAICPLRAQRNTREEIAADIERTGGVHFLYPMDHSISYNNCSMGTIRYLMLRA